MTCRLLRLYAMVLLSSLPVVNVCAITNDPDSSGEDVIYSIFKEAVAKSDRDKAADCARQYISGVDTSYVDIAVAEMSDFLGQYYSGDKFMFSKSIEWYQRAKYSYEQLGESGKSAWMALELGKLRYRLGRYDKALAYVMEAMPVFENNSDTKGMAECCNVLGAIYFASKNYTKSNYYASMFLNYSKELNDTTLMVMAMNNMAVYANMKLDSVKSRTFISESISLCEGLGDTSMLCNLYLNLAASYLNSDNPDLASGYLEKAKHITGDIAEDGKYHYLEGVLDMMDGSDSLAENHLLKAIEYYSGGEFAMQSQKCHMLLDRIYAARGDTVNAYRELSRYYEIESNLLREDVFMELFEYQNEIIQKNEIEKVTSRRNSVLLVSLIISLAIISVSFLLFLLHRTKVKNKAEMKAQKTILEMKKMQEYSMNRLTEDVVAKLTKIAGETDNPEIKFKLMCLSGEMSGDNGKNLWEEMGRYVPEFNSDFYKNLIKDFPSLTTNERRLCALLNLNMSTKEIAMMTHQTPHSIKIARYRLRSKLNLSGSKMTLQEFLSRYN